MNYVENNQSLQNETPVNAPAPSVVQALPLTEKPTKNSFENELFGPKYTSAGREEAFARAKGMRSDAAADGRRASRGRQSGCPRSEGEGQGQHRLQEEISYQY